MNISTFLTAVAITALSTAQALAEAPTIAQFKFETQFNSGKISEDIVADIYGDSLIVGIIPFQQTVLNLKATFQATATATVKVNGVDQVSTITENDFGSPVSYVVSSADGTRTYKVRLIYTGLPLIYVYTKDAAPIVSKDSYVTGTIKVYPNEAASTTFSAPMQIKGRGNTTWTLDKKPYRIKLATAASMLGMPSDKDWVLLANHLDRSLMRNSLAFYLGHNMNLAYTPRTTHVDLVLNGVYQGNYEFGEHIKVDKDRVDIKELEEEDVDEEKITGGYFLEQDNFRDGLFFESPRGLPFVIKSPEDLPQAQLDYIKTYIQQTEDAIFSDDFGDSTKGYRKYIDPGTFIEWYWVMEILKNIDARDGSSMFYYKDRGEKLNMGPLWDLDVAAGNVTVETGDDPTAFYVREGKWFKRLFEDSLFRRAAEDRWFTLRDSLLMTLPGKIDEYATKLQRSQQQNFYKWDVLNKTIWPSPSGLGSYASEVNYLKEWLATRIAWIDSQIEEPVVVIDPPMLDSPATSTTVDGLNPTLKWFTAELAETYELQVSPTETFATTVVSKILTDTTYAITEQLGEQAAYYWRARSVKEDIQSDWSEVRSFMTPLITGVGEGATYVRMFPNPATSELYIEIPSFAVMESAELIDALGRTAASSAVTRGATTKIDVSNLQRGMYFVVLRGGDKPVRSKVMLR